LINNNRRLAVTSVARIDSISGLDDGQIGRNPQVHKSRMPDRIVDEIRRLHHLRPEVSPQGSLLNVSVIADIIPLYPATGAATL
jgi:hypothetical protein